MILHEVINSGTLPQKKFVVRSEEDYESLQCKTMKTNLFKDSWAADHWESRVHIS